MNGDILYVKLDQLQPNPWNPNRQSDFIFERELDSLETHGQLVPVLVRELKKLNESDEAIYEIIDGEHRWRAMGALYWENVAINNLGFIPDSTAMQLTVIMNEVKGKPNPDLLSDLLKQLEVDIGKERLLEVMPYNTSELNNYLSTLTTPLIDIPVPPVHRNGPDSPDKTPSPDKSINYEEQDRQTNKNFSDGVVQSNPDSKTMYLKLPVEIADQLQRQIDRVNLLLYPEEKDPSQVLPATAIQIICQLVSQIEDEKIKT